MAGRVEELKAKISVEDNASENLEKITRMWQRQENQIKQLKVQMTRLREENKRLREGLSKKTDIKIDTKHAEHNVNRLERALRGLRASATTTGRGIMSVFSGVRGMIPSFLTMATMALGGGYAGRGLFDATVYNAAQYEQNQAIIDAMFRDKKKGETYVKMMQQLALQSPLLNSTDIFENSRMFISITKDLNQLRKIWGVIERLVALNPNEAQGGGTAGAAFALSEAFAGDLTSLKERFNLNTKDLKVLKNMNLDKQLETLDKYFNKMGVTKKMINDVADTTLGIWGQIEEVSRVAGRMVGKPTLGVLKPFLNDTLKILNDPKRTAPYIKFGQTMVKGIAHGFVKTAKSIGKWIDGIVNDPAFQRLNSISEKFDFILDKVTKSFINWWDGSGKTTITHVTSGIIYTMISGLEKNIPRIADIGIRIGIAVAGGILKGIASIRIPDPLDLLASGTKKLWSIGSDYIKGRMGSKKTSSKNSGKPTTSRDARLIHTPPRAIGVRRITKDNTLIRAHEGETLLTKQESKQLKHGSGNLTIAKIADTIIVREEADIDKIIQKIVDRYKTESVRLGGSW